MPLSGEWVTVATGKYVREIAQAPDTVLSFQEIANQVSHILRGASFIFIDGH
jgi:hypothetical protein